MPCYFLDYVIPRWNRQQLHHAKQTAQSIFVEVTCREPLVRGVQFQQYKKTKQKGGYLPSTVTLRFFFFCVPRAWVSSQNQFSGEPQSSLESPPVEGKQRASAPLYRMACVYAQYIGNPMNGCIHSRCACGRALRKEVAFSFAKLCPTDGALQPRGKTQSRRVLQGSLFAG